MSSLNLYAAQSAPLEPEHFQNELIAGMTDSLLRDPSPPCLLRAPTGSGKTFMISRVLENVSAARPTLWLWFLPFVNLVQQTEDALAANCPGLSPVMLSTGRNQETQAGMVLLSTAQGVARARDRNAGYDADADDDTRTLAGLIARARARNLAIGLVVDEAHIGLDSTTEFGKFARWLVADFLIMATATPKDERLLEFLAFTGKSAFESFAVSRDEVVSARLNKRYIEAVVYDLRQSVQTIADLKRTVLRQAWRRHLRLKRQLKESGVVLTPLLLVQVANGDKTVEAAARDLVTLCKVPLEAIGQHSSNSPDPVLMAAIANDISKEVLIFKQSAGTGFDAPRAFVLASTKPVNDPDFALQFIGRVMRVARPIRDKFPKSVKIPEDLDTAYVYLADAEAQSGFEAAVLANRNVKSQLEGQTEKLLTRQTLSGAIVYTNRQTPQMPVLYDLPIPEVAPAVGQPLSENLKPSEAQTTFFDNDEVGVAHNSSDEALDELIPLVPTSRRDPQQVATRVQLVELLTENEIRTYPLNREFGDLPAALARERRPEMRDMQKVSETVATRLPISDELSRGAARAALNRLKEKEIHTELTQGERREEDVQIITDRNALSREAISVLKALPQVEDEDIRIIVDVLSQRLRPSIKETYEHFEEDQQAPEIDLQRFARDAAFWVIRREAGELAELMQSIVAESTVLEDADPLPDAMVFPIQLVLADSRRNIYGVLPPSEEDLAQIEHVLLLAQREYLIDRDVADGDRRWRIARYDGVTKLNREERSFAKALDRAEFVQWWHRNPDRKTYSVRLVRGDHRNYFYPDFVVCLSPYDGSTPAARLIETKQDVKDAARKARRIPKRYGKVLFLTKDNQRLRIVNDDGSLGRSIDGDDLEMLREWMRDTWPVR